MISAYRLIILLLIGLTLGGLANAAGVPDLYSAAVSVADRSEEARLQAYQDSLAAVLVKVSGDRNVASNPNFLALLESAPILLQQYRYTAEGELWAAFDGAAVERAAHEAGIAVWGSDRPAILVWLAVDWGSGSRGLITAGEETDLRRSIERVAASRGLVLVWPLFDSTDRAAMAFSDLWGGFTEKINAASARYDASGILVGRATRGPSRLQVRWSLDMGGLQDEWRGGLSPGIHKVADTLAQRFAVRDFGTGEGTTVAIVGINSLADYARVAEYLENLSLVRHLGVRRIAGDTILFDLELQGDATRLPRIIDLNNTLRRLAMEDTPAAALGADQRYRYSP